MIVPLIGLVLVVGNRIRYEYNFGIRNMRTGSGVDREGRDHSLGGSEKDMVGIREKVSGAELNRCDKRYYYESPMTNTWGVRDVGGSDITQNGVQ